VLNDPDEVIVDFKESRIMDQSAIEAVNKLTERYLKENKTIHLRHLSKDCTRLIQKAEKICVVNVLEDPNYFVAIDNFRIKRLNGA
jgi:SulP family sulfate permease